MGLGGLVTQLNGAQLIFGVVRVGSKSAVVVNQRRVVILQALGFAAGLVILISFGAATQENSGGYRQKRQKRYTAQENQSVAERNDYRYFVTHTLMAAKGS